MVFRLIIAFKTTFEHFFNNLVIAVVGFNYSLFTLFMAFFLE